MVGGVIVGTLLLAQLVTSQLGYEGTNTGNSADLNFEEIFGKPPTDNITDRIDCQCVPISRCHQSDDAATNGEGVIDVRLGQCPNDGLQICCENPIPENEVTTWPPNSGGRKPECGKRNAQGVGFRITPAGKEAQFGEFPWMTAVLHLVNDNSHDSPVPKYKCGGSLIHPRVVMTATHCTLGLNSRDLIVRTGEWDSQSLSEVLPYQEVGIEEIVRHEGYSSGGLWNDISLLFLTEPFTLTDNVGTICLPYQDEVIYGEKCYASGWGKDAFGSKGKYSNILKKVQLPIVPRDECQRKFRTTRLGHRFELHKSFICAGGKDAQDTCEGDGGSPLVCPVPNTGEKHYKQAGMVAWGIGCNNLIPAAYVNVALFRPWIDEQMNKHGLDTSSYQLPIEIR